ncbi:MAG: hypothetical protein RLZZ385_1463 [Pseudomonadota bacterium]|jgi:hypothetical protein
MLSESSSDESLSSRWHDDDPDVRIRAVQELAKTPEQSQTLLTSIANDDPLDEVRCAAVEGLLDLGILGALQSTGSPNVQEAATLQVHRVLAGARESAMPEEQRLALIGGLDGRSVKQVALLTKHKATGDTALHRIDDNQELADLALFAASAHVRKQAAAKLSDPELMADLRDKVAGSDKSVFKLLDQRLAELGTDTPPAADPADEAQPEATAAAVAPTQASEVAPEEPGGQPEQTEPAAVAEPVTTAEPAVPPVAPEITPEQQAMIAGFRTELAAVSHKDTPRLNQLLQAMRDLVLVIQWPKALPPEGVFKELKDLQTQGNALFEQNRVYQQQLFDAGVALLAELRQALEAGQSTDAMQTWDRLQGKLKNLGGKLSKELKKQLAEFRPRINELKDWKNFAATEKKKEIIQRMEQLLATDSHPPERARQINAMHLEWKALGRTAQNEELWQAFKTLSDRAYEPCKEYFKQQKQQMAENYRQRVLICEQLEAWLAELDRNAINVGELNRIESKAKDDWKLHAPVEQSKIKKLQKRFYAVMDEFRQLRRGTLSVNLEQKQALVARAQELVSLEDNQAAMNEARALQAQWKAIGPGSFKDDRKLWETFRAACDAIFQKRDERKRDAHSVIEQALSRCKAIIGELDGIAQLPDEELRAAHNTFKSLQRDFRDALDARIKKERKTLQDQFYDSVRRIEARLKRLPDKKVLQVQQALAARVEFCQSLENALLACTDDQQLQAVVAAVDMSAWEALGAGHKDFDPLLEQRWASLRSLTSRQAFDRLQADTEAQARTLCIDVEIKAGLESPAEDQSRRMQQQLSQLQSAFGRLQQSAEDNLKLARDSLLKLMCMGPLAPTVRQQLQQRLDNAIAKLA